VRFVMTVSTLDSSVRLQAEARSSAN